MSNIIDITTYKPKVSDIFLLDANVWIYIFLPIGNTKQFVVNKYSNFFSKLYKSQSTIVVTSLILSEIFNVYAKTEFNILKDKIGKRSQKYNKKIKFEFKKNFKPSNKYRRIMLQTTNFVYSKMQKYKGTKFINDNFDTLNLQNLLNNIENHDFNDKYYIELAKNNNLKIVANDIDLKKARESFDLITIV